MQAILPSPTHLSCKYLALSVEPRARQAVIQGDHLSGKPGNVREFETCQGNVSDVVNSQGIVEEMSGKKSCDGNVSQNCSLLDEYLRSYGYLSHIHLSHIHFILRNH